MLDWISHFPVSYSIYLDYSKLIGIVPTVYLYHTGNYTLNSPIFSLNTEVDHTGRKNMNYDQKRSRLYIPISRNLEMC